jgi:hypothetical protein
MATRQEIRHSKLDRHSNPLLRREPQPLDTVAIASAVLAQTTWSKGDVVVSDIQEQIARLLHDASETHHHVYRITDGVDSDWASWYTDWLIHLSELPKLLGTTPVRSELIYMLVKLDKEFTRGAQKGGWEGYYSRELVSHFKGG